MGQFVQCGDYSTLIDQSSQRFQADTTDITIEQVLARAAFWATVSHLPKNALALEIKGIDTTRQRQNLMKIYEGAKLSLAREIWSKVAQHLSSSKLLPRKLAEYHLASGYTGEAPICFTRPIKPSPGDLVIVNAFADQLHRQGQNRLADSIVTEALQFGSKISNFTAWRPESKWQFKDYKMAIHHFKVIESQSVLAPWQYKMPAMPIFN